MIGIPGWEWWVGVWLMGCSIWGALVLNPCLSSYWLMFFIGGRMLFLHGCFDGCLSSMAGSSAGCLVGFWFDCWVSTVWLLHSFYLTSSAVVDWGYLVTRFVCSSGWSVLGLCLSLPFYVLAIVLAFEFRPFWQVEIDFGACILAFWIRPCFLNWLFDSINKIYSRTLPNQEHSIRTFVNGNKRGIYRLLKKDHRTDRRA